ncbi:MAG: hypothetical protein HY432_00650 [Candidatus Liptonbacteria bacterium]|nr:hypothetical protein [Candidatus Liptonbacteria bacterium]
MVHNFRRELIIRISLIAGSLIAFAAIAYFLSGAIEGQAKKVSSDRTAINKRSQLIENLASQRITSEEVKKYQQAINLLLPQKDDLVNFSSWLDGLSRVRQISMNFSFSGEMVPSNDTSAGHIRFSLNANGEYANLMNFLRDIEAKAPRYTTVFDDFDLKRAGGNYSIIIGGRVFFR